MTEAPVTVEVVTYTARENRKYARRKLAEAQSTLVGRSGLTMAEKIDQLHQARTLAQTAIAALEEAITQYAEEFVAPQDADVENYDADELEAHQASF